MTTITKDRVPSHMAWRHPFKVYSMPLSGDWLHPSAYAGAIKGDTERLFVVEFGSYGVGYSDYYLYVFSEITEKWYANAATESFPKQALRYKAAHLARPKGQELTYLPNLHMIELVRCGVGYEVVRKFNQARSVTIDNSRWFGRMAASQIVNPKVIP